MEQTPAQTIRKRNSFFARLRIATKELRKASSIKPETTTPCIPPDVSQIIGGQINDLYISIAQLSARLTPLEKKVESIVMQMSANTTLVSSVSTEVNALATSIHEITDQIGPLLIDSSRHSSLLQRKFPEFTPFRVARPDYFNQDKTLIPKKSKLAPVPPVLDPDPDPPPPTFNPLTSYTFTDCFGI
eukprot:TRINITY_DN3293_c0_g1_i4.p1 TRINITY_DN3293_c0_g1~~TRINITY_DN3293_c0_g1_i4.p1  ORF type:complete len:218 (-),score=10.76 TRINITY_DN3293_c0_g1_i4:245-805(-)